MGLIAVWRKKFPSTPNVHIVYWVHSEQHALFPRMQGGRELKLITPI